MCVKGNAAGTALEFGVCDAVEEDPVERTSIVTSSQGLDEIDGAWTDADLETDEFDFAATAYSDIDRIEGMLRVRKGDDGDVRFSVPFTFTQLMLRYAGVPSDADAQDIFDPQPDNDDQIPCIGVSYRASLSTHATTSYGPVVRPTFEFIVEKAEDDNSMTLFCFYEERTGVLNSVSLLTNAEEVVWLTHMEIVHTAFD